MYTIIMNDDKSLTTSIKTRLYQYENLADEIQFLLPETYGELNLRDFNLVLEYVDAGNVPHAEILVADEELYKNKLRYVLPVTSELTRFAGKIEISLNLYNVDLKQGKAPVLESGETIIEILPKKDYFAMDTSSMKTINDKMIQLDIKLEEAESLLESAIENGGCDCEEGSPSVDIDDPNTPVKPEDPDEPGEPGDNPDEPSDATDNVVEF